MVQVSSRTEVERSGNKSRQHQHSLCLCHHRDRCFTIRFLDFRALSHISGRYPASE